MVNAGLSDDIGSWKIMAILLPRTARMPGSSSFNRSTPSNRISPLSIRPGGFGIRRSTDSAVTLLPEPDSPTIASVSPGSRWNDTPSTAVTVPRSVRNRVVRFLTSSSGRVIAASRSMAHLFLQILIDPDAGVDRSRADGTGAQLAGVILHPGPPGREDVGRRQPDIGRLVDDIAGDLADHLDALFLVRRAVHLVDFGVQLRIGPLRRVPDFLG